MYMGKKIPLLERFWAKVNVAGPDDCWEWTACKSRYGIIRHFGKNMSAHRVSWQINIGLIPEGMLVCHKCDNPICVNPNHLFVGTWADNHSDMHAKMRHKYGEDHHKSKLTESDVVSIRAAVENGSTKAALARRYGVSDAQIGHIVRRKHWRHVK